MSFSIFLNVLTSLSRTDRQCSISKLHLVPNIPDVSIIATMSPNTLVGRSWAFYHNANLKVTTHP
ncbi:hypothetical protein [Sphingobacterium mizutaii]|uniref:hypothetical protein n=1 Tax=Sphingobacterium mizutaii TaxID=1010 RepID=UPI00289D4FA7|nr:hypothetical protein [Sphingobacterium mizutaii]